MSQNPDQSTLSRRIFVKTGIAALGLSAFASVRATVDFLFPKVLYEPSPLLRLKRPQEYLDETCTFDEENRLFIFRNANGIRVLTAICTHLGCTVARQEESGTFKCPCHGSRFSGEGKVLGGPAPKSLSFYYVDLAKDGRLQVHTNRPVAADFVCKIEGTA